MQRPSPDEYPEYCASYISRVPSGNILEVLASQLQDTTALLGGLSEATGNRRYAPGKWSLKEVIGHLCDVERVFQVRALAFARCDPASLPGIDQDLYVANGEFDARSLESMVDEFRAVRQAGLTLFRTFGPSVWGRRGCANDVSFSTRAVPYILAGHELHHRQVLETRYLNG